MELLSKYLTECRERILILSGTNLIWFKMEISEPKQTWATCRALFGGISLLGGFYVAQTISLSFGALGVNDVIAAVLCVLLTEYATKFYYSQPKVTFPVALLNNFKMGFTYGLFIDAFKLASWWVGFFFFTSTIENFIFSPAKTKKIHV